MELRPDLDNKLKDSWMMSMCCEETVHDQVG